MAAYEVRVCGLGVCELRSDRQESDDTQLIAGDRILETGMHCTELNSSEAEP